MTTAATEEDGNEAIDKIATKPNIDFYFDKNPKFLTREDHLRYIEIERNDRARQIEKGKKV